MYALIRVTGAVQGIGYRPFVAELATKYGILGEVKNLGGIVEITAVGDEDRIGSFTNELRTSSPEGSIVINVSLEYLKEKEPEGLNGFSGFRIVESSEAFDDSYIPVFPPDIGICRQCTKELFDENDRRYGYPLISCASCGPRFSILNKLPYDRINTTMGDYLMCDKCGSEYQRGRRRHAQTISCHQCGPQLLFNDEKLDNDLVIDKAVSILQNGGILGIKGIGGYQFAANPYNHESVNKLRKLKGRDSKPFAVMFDTVSDIRRYCNVSSAEKDFLESAARPIVLLDNNGCSFPKNVCGNSRQIGAFLPSSGIHSLIMKKLKCLIVTSGNISGEPMLISDKLFREKFGNKIDGIIWYKRDILRPLDDSVMQIIKDPCGNDIPRFIRRARGYVPLPVFLKDRLLDKNLYIAAGADLKNTFAIGYGDRIVISQFFGDMEDAGVLKLHLDVFKEFYDIFRIKNLSTKKEVVIADMHPGYHSTGAAKNYFKWIETDKKEFISIQHHHAHIGSVMAENGLNKCIGIAFDGTGYGTDESIWGSEFLVCKNGEFEKKASLKSVKIVGSDEAMKNAAILTACYLYDADVDVPDDIISKNELALIEAAIQNNINTFPNSGMGRLFDVVSHILGICSYNSFEGECAVSLQNAAEEYLANKYGNDVKEESYKIYIDRALMDEESYNDPELALDLSKSSDGITTIDTTKLLKKLLSLRKNESAGKLAFHFHLSMAIIVRHICKQIKMSTDLTDVCLSGGVFANRLLLYLCDKSLREEGFMVYYNSILPTNDGGISLGQIYLADLKQKNKEN